MVERIRTLLESRHLTPTQFADAIGVARPIVSHILSGRNKPSLEVVQRILAAMPDLAMPWLLNGTGPMLAATSAAAVPSVPPGAIVAPLTSASAPAPASGPVDDRRSTAVGAVIGVPHAPATKVEPAEQEVVKAAVPMAAPSRPSPLAPGRNLVAPKRFVATTAPVEALPQAPATTPAPIQPLVIDIEWPLVAVPVQDAVPGLPVSLLPPPVEIPVAAVPPPSVPAADETAGAALVSALFAGGDKPIRRIVIFYRDGSFADYQPE